MNKNYIRINIRRIFLIVFAFVSKVYTQEMDFSQKLSLDSLLNIKIATAAKYDQTISQAPASIIIITSDEIHKFGYNTLEEVLNTIAGFYSSYDRNYSYLGVRGFGRPTDYNDRILILLDGHTTNENFYGSASIGNDLGIDMNSINRIEIVRGPGSTLYGTGAMFAVINIITKKGNEIDGINISYKHGSFNKNQGSFLIGKELDNGLNYSCSGIIGDIKGQDLFFKEYYNPPESDGISYGNDWEKFYGIQSNLSYRSFTLTSYFSSRKKGIPTGSYEDIFNDPRAKTLDERASFEIKYENDLNYDKNIAIRGYYDHYFYTGTYPSQILTEDLTRGQGIGTEIRFRWDFISNNRLITGIEYIRNFKSTFKYWSQDSIFFDGNFPYSIFSLYLHDEYQFTNNLIMTLGVRRDVYSNTSNPITPRCALVYFPNKSTTLKLLYGEAFRAPNMYEINYFDPIGSQKLSSNLKPENIKTTEFIWEQKYSDAIYGNLSLFMYNIKNLIDVIQDKTDSLYQFQNSTRMRALGFETSIRTHTELGLDGYANYSYQYAINTDSKERLTNSPIHLVKLGLIYPILKNVHGAIEVHYESNRKTIYNSETNPFFLTNIILGFHPDDHLMLSLAIRNLFNVTYSTPGGFEHLQPSIQQDGRTYIGKIEVKL